jgi:hypothetical protein
MTCSLGCCDASGICQDGFLDDQCGSGGTTCQNCASANETCGVDTTPRSCTTQASTCPASFSQCTPGTTTPVPVNQPGVCTAQDLNEAQAACATGADSAGCAAFLATLNANGASGCASCLAPFIVPFAEETGIFLCVAPFVDASCNVDTGCFTACETASCSQCPAGQAASCQQQATVGTCGTYQEEAACTVSALASTAAFCDPNDYATFGAWLKGVGGHYCE